MADSFFIPNLAGYQKKPSTGIILTKPGYDVYFYSRADKNLNPYPVLQSEKNYQTFSQINPTYHISSSGTEIPIVTMLQISSNINNSSGSSANLEIIDPQGVEYFKPTIGDSSKAPPDYDHSFDQPQHRIGSMDTIVIKLNNSVYLNSNNIKKNQETVFRGVIANIERSQSPKGGTIIRLSCLDFSEFLRQMIAIPVGFFTTISLAITGRGLTNNLLKYANVLLSGHRQFPGITAAISRTVDFLTTGTVADGTIAPSTTSSQDTVDDTHAMTCPPFFWLQYAQYNNHGKPDDIYGGAQNIAQQIQALITASVTAGQEFASIFEDATSNITNNVYQNLSSNAENALFNLLTPEDQEAIKSYQAFVNDGIVTSKASKFDVLNNNKSNNDAYQKQHIAWILSDLYLEKGLITFEDQQVWATMFQAAARSNRECYFDIAPKINPAPLSMFDTASVKDLGVNDLTGKYNPQNLDDIHPNIGILKYRLSPCFLPYPMKGPKPDTEFRYFNITDDMIMETTQSENEQGVYSAVYGWPTSFNAKTIKDLYNSIALGQNKSFFAYAQSVDPQIEKRLGYRFMTDHDNKIKIPIMMYLVSYVLLQKSQLSMFSQIVKILGNPIIQPGSIVRMESQGIDYYCNEVVHQWSFSGYVTILNLEYGHQTGSVPAAISGYGVEDQFVQAANMACQMAAEQVGEFVKSSVNIGSVNEQCLIGALWDYMTCRANTSALLKQCTRSYETAHPYKVPADWITLVNTAQNSTIAPYSFSASSYFSVPQPSVTSTPIVPSFTNIILNAIKSTGLDAYNVTLNLILNIIGHESSWCSNNQGSNSNDTVDYGWFQINSTHFSEGIDAETACTNFQAACQFALNNVLLPAMKNNNPNKTGGVPFLNAITAYNQGQNGLFNYSSFPYAANVLGATQVNAIANGTQLPSNAKPGTVRTGLACADPTADLTKWPYDVYGPIGMQLSALTSQGMSAADAKALLLNWQPGSSATGAMQTSVKYIDKLLRKYQNQSFLPAPIYSQLISQDDLFSKVIAAWFSDEKDAGSNNYSAMTNAIKQIKMLYQQCIACTGINPVTYSAQDTSELNAVFDAIKFISPLGPNAKISSGFRTASRPQHEGIDMVLATDSATTGAPVVAPADGWVTGYTTGGTGGLAMSINHTDAAGNISGAQSIFYDIGTYQAGIQQGSFVKQGQTVASLPTSENQGASPAGNDGITRVETGFHLHWELRGGCNDKTTAIAGAPVDPASVLNRQGRPLASA